MHDNMNNIDISNILVVIKSLYKYISNTKNINEYKPNSGYIYCIHNEMYNYYGPNIFKLGCTENLEKRIANYTTSYIEQPCYKITSKILCDNTIAEKLLFNKLKIYRIKNRREFFNCDLEIIKIAIQETRDFLSKYDTRDKLIELAITNLAIYRNEFTQYLTDTSSAYSPINKTEDEVKEKEIDELILADKDTDKFDVVKHKLAKTKHDKNILTAKHIRDTFGLNHLDKPFLVDLKRVSNVEKFKNALIFLANEKYRKQYIEKYKNIEFVHIIANLFKRIDLIESFIRLFWRDGLLSTDVIDVYSIKGNISEDQQKYFEANTKNLRYLFESLKRKENPKNQYHLVQWLDCILKEFFGGFVELKISKLYGERKGKDKEMLKYRKINIDARKYIELILIRYIRYIDCDYLTRIKHLYSSIDCSYTDLHDRKKIGDFFNISNYMFDTSDTSDDDYAPID